MSYMPYIFLHSIFWPTKSDNFCLKYRISYTICSPAPRRRFAARKSPDHLSTISTGTWCILQYVRGRHFGNMTILVLYSGLLASQRQVAMISEMIHSASLIHDDVVDQADCRRGKPSVNVLWNHKKVSATFPGQCSREFCLLRYTAFVRLCCTALCTQCCLFRLLIVILPCSASQLLLYVGAEISDLSRTKSERITFS